MALCNGVGHLPRARAGRQAHAYLKLLSRTHASLQARLEVRTARGRRACLPCLPPALIRYAHVRVRVFPGRTGGAAVPGRVAQVHHGNAVWAHLYLVIRSGHFREALELAQGVYGEYFRSREPIFVSSLEAYLASGDGRWVHPRPESCPLPRQRKLTVANGARRRGISRAAPMLRTQPPIGDARYAAAAPPPPPLPAPRRPPPRLL